MRRYFIKSLSSLIHLLIAQGIIAFDPPLTSDNQLANLNLNLAPQRETPTHGGIVGTFDLNEYPSSEPTIESLSSTCPPTSSEHALSLLREHPEENLVLSTSESIPHQLSSPSSLKRKEVTKPYVEQMKNRRQRVSEQHGHVAHNNGIGFPDHFTALNSEIQVTTKKPTGLLEFTRPSRGKNVRGLAPAHQEEQPLVVNNWDYVKLDLNIEGIPEHIHAGYGDPPRTVQQFFEYMHQTHPYLPHEETFWIPMSLVRKFWNDYRLTKTEFKYPPEISFGIRQSGIRDIMLKIAEDKLHINSCWSSLGGIKAQLKQRIDAKRPTTHFIRKITKLSVTMSVLYLTLFREHEGQTLSQSHVSSMVGFIQDTITALAEKPASAGLPGSELAENLRKMLHNIISKHKSNSGSEMKMACNIFEYWLTRTRTPSQASLPCTLKVVYSLIRKIIFFSNYKYLMHKGLAHEMNEKKRRK